MTYMLFYVMKVMPIKYEHDRLISCWFHLPHKMKKPFHDEIRLNSAKRVAIQILSQEVVLSSQQG